jgi:glutamyl-tRNA synthetase
MKYLGRLAPTPTGHLHLGHALTFSMTQRRASDADGRIFLRMEDLDPQRCSEEFARAAIDDLLWMGLEWSGEPIFQSQRRHFYLEAWRRLKEGGFIYPCHRSRREISSLAPHEEEPVFPVEWRADPREAKFYNEPAGVNWRFKVPDGESISFMDQNIGPLKKNTLRDFGDFLVWNRNDIPAYELAVVVDDMDMGITEVVRGADLLTSTARQILIYRALGASPPAWFHCPLVCDSEGRRLAKRTGGLSLRDLRAEGFTPEQVLDLAKESLR